MLSATLKEESGMSNEVTGAVLKRNLGTVTRKAVMLLLADKASDDGTGIWASKERMASELCMTTRGLRLAIKALVSEGLVMEVGRRPCRFGYTQEYAINLAALAATPLVDWHQKSTPEYGSPLNRVQGDPGMVFRGTPEYGSGKPPLEPPLEPPIITPSALGGSDDGFDVWWSAYPKRVGKSTTKAAYARAVKKLGSDSAAAGATLLEKLQAHVALWRKNSEFPRYVPHPTTWLNQGRWDDELETAAPNRTNAFAGHGPVDLKRPPSFDPETAPAPTPVPKREPLARPAMPDEKGMLW
jgi:hypothetical protein